MKIFTTILEAIGHTPLVRLNKIVGSESATLLAKCEFLNPTGSIKDRMAYYVICDAERRGLLKPGGTIVENTSGNTGLGVAMAAAVKGYRCVFTMPDKMSVEKVNMLKAFGAEVVITPTDVPGDSPEHYVERAKQIARDTPGAFYLNQYHNKANIDAHYHSTGKELWEESDNGGCDAIVAGLGTGGTLSGIARYFKEHKSAAKMIGVDPIGSVHYHYFYTKTLGNPHVYKVEGIGEDILCEATDFSVIDEIRQVNDKESFQMARRLVREEGLFCGGSSGAVVTIAAQVARELGPGKTVIAILTDSATRYITKHLSDAWMKDHGFLESGSELGYVEDLLRSRPQVLHFLGGKERVEQAVAMMREHGVSQLPVVDQGGRPVSIVHEIDILHALQSGTVAPDASVREIARPVTGLIFPKARLEELAQILESDRVAVVVDNQKMLAIVSKIDLISYMMRRAGTGGA